MRALLLFLAALVPVADLVLAVQPDRKPRKVAFLVGVGTYDHNFSDLGRVPEKDVAVLAKELAGGGFEVHTLLGSKPDGDNDRATKANVEKRFAGVLTGGPKLRGGDTLVVVLCGHGLQDDEPYFCPVDALPTDFKSMVSLNKLIADAEPFGATALFLVDACRNDPKRGRSTGIQGNSAKLRSKTAVLFSCKAGEVAFQDDKEGHGVFTFAVLETIRAGGGEDWDGLVAGVKRAFRSDKIKAMLPPGRTQTPVQANGELEFTALLPKRAAAPPADEMAKKDDPPAGKEVEAEVAAGVRMKFVWVPATKEPAQLGSPKAERDAVLKHEPGLRTDPMWDAAEAEGPGKAFTTKGFWMAKYETTQDEWVKVTGGPNPSYFDGTKNNKAKGMTTGRFPVENVSWDDIQPFLKALNDRPAARAAFGKAGAFALPHEDEWEYACRGGRGNKQAFFWGDELNGTQENCNGTDPFGTTKAGPRLERTCAVDAAGLGYEVHPWGLVHMHGNVWEWCENTHKLHPAHRALRGGYWDEAAHNCRAAMVMRADPNFRGNGGFRVIFRPAS